MMPLSTYILAEFPSAIPSLTTEWDKVGTVLLAEAAVVVSSLGLLYPTVPAPSATRLLAAVAGGPLADPQYAGYSMVMGLSVGFDAAQAAVVAGYATTPVPIPPPTSVPLIAVLQPLIYAAYRASLTATNPSFAGFQETANVQRLMSAFAKFVNGAYV